MSDGDPLRNFISSHSWLGGGPPPRLGEPYQCTVQISLNIVRFHGLYTQYFESPLHFNAKSILLCSCDWKSLLAIVYLRFTSQRIERERLLERL